MYRLLPLLSTTVLLVGLGAAAGCLGDAERGNPLDPLSDDFQDVGRLSGHVTDRALAALSGARLTAAPLAGGGVQRTDVTTGAGQFAFDALSTGRYRLVAEKEGYAAAGDTVEVRLGETTAVDLRLNGLPVVQPPELRTVHISRWWPQDDRFLLEVAVTVADPDGPFDVEAVWVELPGLGWVDSLASTATPGRYAKTYEAAELPSGSVHGLLGNALVARARDRAGAVSGAAPAQPARVVDLTPVALDPQGREELTDRTPTLVWERAGVPFPFTYRVEVVRVDDNVQTVVRQYDDLPSDRTSIEVTTPLAQGSYFWTVWVVDAFGNRSRSKEAGFVIL